MKTKKVVNKLKSRKFWVTIIVIAAAIIYGLRSMGIEDNPILSGICVVCAAAAGIAYVFAQAMVESTEAEAEALEESEEVKNE